MNPEISYVDCLLGVNILFQTVQYYISPCVWLVRLGFLGIIDWRILLATATCFSFRTGGESSHMNKRQVASSSLLFPELVTVSVVDGNNIIIVWHYFLVLCFLHGSPLSLFYSFAVNARMEKVVVWFITDHNGLCQHCYICWVWHTES